MFFATNWYSDGSQNHAFRGIQMVGFPKSTLQFEHPRTIFKNPPVPYINYISRGRPRSKARARSSTASYASILCCDFVLLRSFHCPVFKSMYHWTSSFVVTYARARALFPNPPLISPMHDNAWQWLSASYGQHSYQNTGVIEKNPGKQCVNFVGSIS